MRLLAGAASGAAAGQADGSGTVSATAWLLAQPFGAWLTGLVGVWVAAGGAGELYLAYSTDFKKDLRREMMSAREAELATWVGRIGLTARGVVLGAVGVIIIQTALNADATRSRGLDGALDTLAGQPFGGPLLGMVALGLIVFGLYSALCALDACPLRLTHVLAGGRAARKAPRLLHRKATGQLRRPTMLCGAPREAAIGGRYCQWAPPTQSTRRRSSVGHTSGCGTPWRQCAGGLSMGSMRRSR
ncbi:MAG: hypothetical protein AVDCRST_MAG77-910 [uncultured Chloroflexi bacterium]|uniref:DUF1206 domain-containing protein n=1 Tax=uncultured Chloroflexota bacterium TaxID=166587 RepID=A0A6J4HQL1_9CHLR|nr:MAG: hypothetical protein AVDCRST_MAG77-910 [uncultured Chloroflexota bacterium]